MSTPPDQLQHRLGTTTRSGRIVRPPTRYEPDPNQVFEDDFSDEDSESENDWEAREELGDDEEDLTDDEPFCGFTDSESQDGSYESADARSSSSDDLLSEEEEQEEEDDFFMETDLDDDDEEEIVEWDTLTADASDSYDSSEDDDI